MGEVKNINELNSRETITVLGAGVNGLTTAIVLLEAGYDVNILTKDFPGQTVSAVAGAVWFPYDVRPRNKVNAWSRISFDKFKELAETPGSGISFIDFMIAVNYPEKPWWLPSIPESHKLEVRQDLPNNQKGYLVNIPLIETPIYLPFLLEWFQALGGRLVHKEISGTEELHDFNLTVNCTGLNSRSLFGDESLYPVQGQVVRVEPKAEVTGMATDFHMGENKDELAYIIPRKDAIILGGSAKKGKSDLTPDEALSQRIIKNCSEYEPKVAHLPVKEIGVGLRPGRDEIRLEKDPKLPVIHNYGHGGAGYTVSWGCAEEVLLNIEH